MASPKLSHNCLVCAGVLVCVLCMEKAKNAALAAAGAIVPDSFEGLEVAVRQTYNRYMHKVNDTHANVPTIVELWLCHAVLSCVCVMWLVLVCICVMAYVHATVPKRVDR